MVFGTKANGSSLGYQKRRRLKKMEKHNPRNANTHRNDIPKPFFLHFPTFYHIFQFFSFFSYAPIVPHRFTPTALGCGLAWSSGVFRQLVHAKQLRGHGFVKAGDGWEFPGEKPPEVKTDEVLEVGDMGDMGDGMGIS